MRNVPAKFLIVIESGGSMVARLFDAQRHPVIEMDGASEEVVETTQGIAPTRNALAPEWDRALAGHSANERHAAQVYVLTV